MIGPSQKLRVAYICQHIDVGGAEELLASYVRCLPSRGWDAVTVCLTRRGRVAMEIEQSGLPFHLIPGEPGPRDPRAFMRLVRLLRELRPDVAHTFLLVGSLYGRLAALAAGVPLIVATEANVYQRKSWRHVWMERWLGRHTHRLIASSRAVQEFASRQQRLPLERLPVLYNAIDFETLSLAPTQSEARHMLGVPFDALVVGCVARLTEQKGHRHLLHAIAALSEQFPLLTLILVGDGPLLPTLQHQARALGIAGRVRFAGVRRDLATVFAALDVFALASLWEGLPLAVLEAMGSGLPVLATDVGGNREAIDPEESGIMVPADDAAALAAALGRLLDDAALRRRLGDTARERSRARFGLPAHLDALLAIYDSGLAEAGRPAR